MDSIVDLTGRRILLIMSSLLLSTVMASLDSSFVPIAVPDMIDDLDSSTAEVVWVALGYLIAASGPMLLAARLADGYGHARFFQIGTTIYATAMIACTFAPDATTLIALRVVQGFGMAMFLPTTFAIATQMYGEKARGKALGLLQMANAFGFVIGPVFAGWLLDAYDWRAIFWSRIPFAILAILLAFFALGFSRPFKIAEKLKTYDYAGAVFLTIALYGILFGCTRLPVEDNHLDPLVWIQFLGGFVFFWLFLRQERRAREPLVDLDLFAKSVPFTKASIAFAALFASFPLYLFVLPIVMINGLEMRAWDAGMALGVVAFATVLVAGPAGRLSDRMGAERLCMLGTALTALGYLSLLFVNTESTVWTMLPGMSLIGLGTGLFFAPNNSLMMGNAPPARAGMVSGLFGTLRQSGYALGFAVTASLFTFVQTFFENEWAYASLRWLPEGPSRELANVWEQGGMWSPETIIFILHLSVILCTGILVISFINSLPRLRMNLRRHTATAAATAGVAAVSMAAYAATAPGYVDVEAAVASLPAELVTEPVAPFGMASRAAVAVAVKRVAAVDAGGNNLYNTQCIACHGPAGSGVEGLGVALVGSEFVATRSTDELVAFFKAGRMPGDPDSVSGRSMPGFAWVAEDELAGVATYLKEL